MSKRKDLFILLLVLTAGCAMFSTQVHRNSSIMDYLYPQGGKATFSETVRLKIPVRVGIAFVPEARVKSSPNPYLWRGSSLTTSDVLTEADKQKLMERIKAEFESLGFVEEIQPIPSGYLQSGGGFANLNQLKTMFGVDLVVLLSFDQVQFTDPSKLSLSYLTLLGASLVSGEKNETKTMMDAVVYDIDSQKLLFRAPGISSVKGRATPLELERELREASREGFNHATSDLTANLKIELDKFKEKVKQKPETYQRTYSPGSRGGGATTPFMLAIAGLLLVLSFIVRRSPRV